MKVASEWFSEADRGAIAAAVAAAEKGTAGEIVPVVATASENYERAEGLAGIVCALAAIAGGWALWQGVVPAQGEWMAGYEPALGLWHILALGGGGYLAGSLGARSSPALKRMLTGRQRMRSDVTRAAAAAFDRFHARGTKGATGIVIYVSLFERMVCVLGDEAISQKVGETEWRDVCDTVTRGIAAGKHVDALAQAIAKCGELLVKHVPIGVADANELTNDLRFLD